MTVALARWGLDGPAGEPRAGRRSPLPRGRAMPACGFPVAASMRLVAFAALFRSVLLQLGSGGIAPLDAISGSALGFQPGQ